MHLLCPQGDSELTLEERILKATETHVLHLQVYVLQPQITTFPSCMFSRKQHMDEFARAGGSRSHQMCEPYSLTVASQYLFMDHWLRSHLSKVTPRTWKPPQRRKNSFLMGLPHIVPHTLFSLIPGRERVQCASQLRGPMFSPRVHSGSCSMLPFPFSRYADVTGAP